MSWSVICANIYVEFMRCVGDYAHASVPLIIKTLAIHGKLVAVSDCIRRLLYLGDYPHHTYYCHLPLPLP